MEKEILWVDGEYLCGELRAAELQPHTFHIHAKNEYFSKEGDAVYRNGQVYRDVIDRVTDHRRDQFYVDGSHQWNSGCHIRQNNFQQINNDW